ncbi:hypothetical protein [Bradyrhizobium sp. CB2312]|uniref:hypothetical protein n=1 Tax=Bradyrhizobium sp. CB2312 TaxID=3039155 RepID=UPI0024B0F758|nr:hypothetical protein [Bradyrhizobium sp. CB2312]WFU77132.1 hypothetical protein QA642_37495 [Bradyrhizobium sp. CB2312]
MARLFGRLILAAAMTAAAAVSLVAFNARPAAAQAAECESECGEPRPYPSPTYSPSPTPTPTSTPTPSSSPSPNPYPSPSPGPSPLPGPTGADSSGNSIGGLAGQRFNQMITNRVLGTVLLGVNEQVNCSNCISAFGSAGSFSAGIHGRKELTNNLSLLAGIAYTQYNEGGYKITSAPIGAFALRYDFTDWGSSRPFFDVGTILTPWEKARYTRSYDTSLGPVSVTSSTNAANYAVYGRAGWISRVSPRDEVAASIEVWQLWQRVSGYSDGAVAFNPFDTTIASGTDRTSLVKIGGQWTHLFGSNIETNINGGWVQSFAGHSGIVATVTGNGTVVPTMGNQGWFEYGGRLGFRVQKGWIVDLFANGTLGPQPVGNTIHGGVGLRINY